MLIAHFAQEIRKLLQVFEESAPLFELLRTMTELEMGLDTHLEKAAANSQHAGQAGADIHNQFAGSRGLLRGLSPRSIYRSIEDLDAGLKDYLSHEPASRSYIGDISRRLEAFSDLFENFLTQQKGVLGFTAIRAAVPLLRDLELTRINLESVLHQIAEQDFDRERLELLTFDFSGHHSLPELSEKLATLNAIFEAIAGLLGLSEEEEIARLVRAETGSFVVEVLLLRIVSKIAKPWFGAMAGFFYRNYTVEGALTSQPKLAQESIKQLMSVRSSFEKANIDTSKLDEHIEEVGVAMAKNVASLIGNQVRFKLDESEFSLARGKSEALPYKPSTGPSDSPRLPK